MLRFVLGPAVRRCPQPVGSQLYGILRWLHTDWLLGLRSGESMEGKHIVAFGGTRPVGVGMHPLHNYILSLAGKDRPKVCCIPTATGDSPADLLRFYGNFPASLSEPSHLDLFKRTVRDIRDYLLSQDVIFVLGGNTANLLAVWRAHGVDLALKEAWEAGVVLCGGSAGSLCWFECGTTDSFDVNELKPLYDGLGFFQAPTVPTTMAKSSAGPSTTASFLKGSHPDMRLTMMLRSTSRGPRCPKWSAARLERQPTVSS